MMSLPEQPLRQAQVINQTPQYYQAAQPIQQQFVQQQPVRLQAVPAPQIQAAPVPQVVEQRRVVSVATPQALPVNQIGNRIFPGVVVNQTAPPARAAAVASDAGHLVIGNRVFPTVQ